MQAKQQKVQKGCRQSSCIFEPTPFAPFPPAHMLTALVRPYEIYLNNALDMEHSFRTYFVISIKKLSIHKVHHVDNGSFFNVANNRALQDEGMFLSCVTKLNLLV